MDNILPAISVIIPVYNSAKYLAECLNSIINQTFKNIEIICIDDGSTDNSLAILKEYQNLDSRIQILTQTNLYAGVARNQGLAVAKGKYLSFLDSDDFFELNMFEEMHKKALEDDSDIVVCGWNNYNNLSGEITRKFEIPENIINLSPFQPDTVKAILFKFSKPNAWTKLYKRELFINNNLQFEACKCYNDMTCVYLSYVLAKKISVMKECFVYYRNNQSSNLTSQWNYNFDCILYAIARLYEELVQRHKYQTYRLFFIKKMASLFKNRFDKLSSEFKIKYAILAKKQLPDIIYYRINNLCRLDQLSEI